LEARTGVEMYPCQIDSDILDLLEDVANILIIFENIAEFFGETYLDFSGFDY
jgi:peroxiredoxin family protein